MFNLTIKGELGGNVLPSEVNAPNSPFTAAWQNFVRELDAAGVKITTANIENAGKTITLTVTRGGQTLELHVTLGTRPATSPTAG